MGEKQKNGTGKSFIMAFLLLASLHSDARATANPKAMAGGLGNPDSWFETINPVRNSRGVFRSPRELPQAVTRTAERRGIISNGIKEKITLPLPNSSRINTSRPEHTLESATARVKELNEKIKTETGIDIAKLASWLGKLAKAIFKTAVDILRNIANVL